MLLVLRKLKKLVVGVYINDRKKYKMLCGELAIWLYFLYFGIKFMILLGFLPVQRAVLGSYHAVLFKLSYCNVEKECL